MAIYPGVILPVCEPDPASRNICIAVDTSASISDRFLGCAIGIAETPIPGNRIELLTFDAAVYPYAKGDAVAQGGGGTRFQAIEDYLQEQAHYPDIIFVFTDGFSPRPHIEHPDRWVWILEPKGTDQTIPGNSRIERFKIDEI